jgi:hypothetical protein
MTFFPFFFGLLLMTTAGPTLAASNADNAGGLLITDFTADSPDLGWFVVNDNVMGGRSDGDFQQQQGELGFTGRTNTNGGGFSSIRTRPMQLDLSQYGGIRLRVLGDGRRYTWRLTTNARWRGRQVSYWADFDTRNGTWATVDIPFSSFIPQFRGYRLDGPDLDSGNITGMGLMIYDKEDGPFSLQLASVRAYPAKAVFSLADYQWKNRVLVVSAQADGDEMLAQQRNELSATSADFAERDMVLVTLLDDAVSTAADRELSHEEARKARSELGIASGSFSLRLIGKDGSVKLSRERAVPMTEIYALIDSMPMRQRETSGG